MKFFFIFVSVSFKVYLKALKVYEKPFQICLFASFLVSFGSGASKIGEPSPNYVEFNLQHRLKLSDSYLQILQEGSKSHLVVGRPCIARKIGFPELILPNDVRNDLYVNLFSAELSRLNKTADRNVEVSALSPTHT